MAPIGKIAGDAGDAAGTAGKRASGAAGDAVKGGAKPGIGKVAAGGAAVGVGVGLLTNNPLDVANGALSAVGLPSLGPSLSGCCCSSCFVLLVIGVVKFATKSG
jgi:hypothetical protein